ncbi:FAD-dependent tricarballylate dehydrogenase TcuA [Georgenia sp. Z1491]|uniref:FAD-dependent tricarballylate dehydrogenase TcuA n=1 Tax=Georgenia sp. Z1491 TaxID=3416707 RepID=UPI003CEF5253
MTAETSSPGTTDVVVVGGGNAAFVAALAAADRGRSVVLLEAAVDGEEGGNSFYTAGATRIVHDGLADLTSLVEPDERHATTEVPPYTEADYVGDLEKVTAGRNDPELSRVLAAESREVLQWLKDSHGARYRLMYERQAYERDGGGYLFWGGLHVGNVGGGVGLIRDHQAAAERAGIDVRYGHRVTELVSGDGAVRGVVAETADGGRVEITAESVVIASGGFEANPEMREKHLGQGWGGAKLRGTPHNTGTMLERALDLGAGTNGDWGSCHAVAWDAWAEDNESNRELTNRLTRGGYPLGIVVNIEGRRFVDEGADFRNYTYAKYGAEILRQPGAIAFQVFDSTQRPLLRTEEYDMPGVGVVVADTLEELGEGMGVDVDAFAATVREFNASIDRSIPADPTVKDGRRAAVEPPKSNWALPIEEGPFYAFPVTCGITFTFGGLATDTHGRVLDGAGEHIAGLYACGEALGGLFAGNYPGGSGLAAGAVFGRRAGTLA